jgi:thiosulfate/3-mercaptopyruvate sulfurtransferase
MRLLLSAAVATLLSGQFAAAAEPLISPAWLAAHRTDPHVVVLDIRPREQHAAGHIPAAVAAPFEGAGWRATQADGAAGALPPVDQIAATIAGLGVGDQDLAVIVGNDFAAEARVYWTFKVLGHSAVSILDGGQKAWVAAGDPVDTAAVTPVPARFTAHLDESLRSSLDDVRETVANGGQTLIDARPVPQFEGKAKSPVVRTFGHLPGAVSIDQSEALTQDGTALKPKADLAALFAKAGDKPVTTYCNTGHLSSTDWFVLSEILHHPHTRMYDGSMSQWTANDSLPVVR